MEVVKVLAKTEMPQKLCYLAMHQDYSSGLVDPLTAPDEAACGHIVVNRLLKGDRGHYGCLEHPAISFSCGFFPHSVMQQARTHRVGVSFDVQSYRYTSNSIIAVWAGEKDIEEVIYFRAVGEYYARNGKKYEYTEAMRNMDKAFAMTAIRKYCENMNRGISEEHARGLLPFDYRQHFVVSFNLRSLFHFLDLRFKKDAQLEIQHLCGLLWEHTKDWCPEISLWYQTQRLAKGKLAP